MKIEIEVNREMIGLIEEALDTYLYMMGKVLPYKDTTYQTSLNLSSDFLAQIPDEVYEEL